MDFEKAGEILALTPEQFGKVFDLNPLPMAIVSKRDGKFIKVNEGFLKSTGFTREQVENICPQSSDFWVNSNDIHTFIELITKEGSIKNLEIRFRINSGEIKTALFSAVIFWWNNEECILGLANDVTELRHYKNEMARLDRLNLIGEMSASIAHEIRNPMTSVKGFLQLFKSQDRYGEDREYIDLMIEELDRANAIITEFLSLAKEKEFCLRLEDLNDKIMAFMPMLIADAMKNDIHIKLELEDIPFLMIDEAEIRQLILNLVRNGLDAMSAGCELAIKTFLKRNEVILAIQDQGPGIAQEVRGKLGTPFITTKDNGTGLGLAVCYSIAQRHNARIEVDSCSAGTVFKIIFPIPLENNSLLFSGQMVEPEAQTYP